ncbi:guanine deaminase [Roseivivax isoporae]|uniref:Guanine deaminase n=1 Tax=Roseivivax isoporae LMG 25204 TaxID=1449351 RepID=X7FAV5_9RHOB|nr:guanine deaminase [Roseivivax isoporae]ETX29224.1 guanine deaminase [Roseivivax isoporae LMG 25204]
MDEAELLLGRVLLFDGNPLTEGPEAVRIATETGVLVAEGRIAAVGPVDRLRAAHPAARIRDFGRDLICPGFVDAHAHYPQTRMIASWGKRLIDWLETYTFPVESAFGDPDHARAVAALHLDLTAAHGTTTICTFCTSHPESVEAYFAEARARGQRVVAGKTCMDRNAPAALRDDPRRAYDESKALIARWHGRDRLGYAITPRFSPTSSPGQLEALGALWAEHPDCPMQTHLSEQTDEIAWVAELFPSARDYLDTYEAFGLLGANGIYGHAIHLTARERDRLAEVGAALAHCPTSNTFIGSGLFDMGLARAGMRVGLATDTGGGSSFSMLRTMAAAYEIGQLRGLALHPAELLWLATAGSADALGLGDRIGRIAPGHEADLCVLDLAATPAIAQRAEGAEDAWEEVFPTLMMGDDRAVRQVYVGGRAVSRAPAG